MPVIPKNLTGGTLGTTSGTLYTASNKAIVKEIILCNKTATAATATLAIDGKTIVGGKPIAANDTLIIPLSSVVEVGKLITGSAGTASAIDYYISGVEI